VIHGEKIKIEARQGGKTIDRCAQGEARAQGRSQQENTVKKDLVEEDQRCGQEEKESRGAQGAAGFREKEGCPQGLGQQDREAIGQGASDQECEIGDCKAGGPRRENQ
jgi:hypothetical protein